MEWKRRGVLIEQAILQSLRSGPQSMFRIQQTLHPTSMHGVFQGLRRLIAKGLVERLPEKRAGQTCPHCGHRDSLAFVYRAVAQQQIAS